MTIQLGQAAPDFEQDHGVPTPCGTVHPEAGPGVTVRTVLAIDPHDKVRPSLACPPSAGRSFDEAPRVVGSLQVAVPASRTSDGAAGDLFPDGWTASTPCLRMVKQPLAR